MTTTSCDISNFNKPLIRHAASANARCRLTGLRAERSGVHRPDIPRHCFHRRYGDAVTPAPVEAVYPVLIKDFPAPRLRTYPVYTVVSEKLHAIALLGLTDEFATDVSRQALWLAFLKKNALTVVPLASVVTALRTNLQPAWRQAALVAADMHSDDTS